MSIEAWRFSSHETSPHWTRPAMAPSTTTAKRCDSGSSKGKPGSIGPHQRSTPGCWWSSRSRATWRTSSGSSSNGSVIEEEVARAFSQQPRCLTLAEPGRLQFAVALVARCKEKHVQCTFLADAGAQATGSSKVARQPFHLATAVGVLAIDERLGGGVDGDDSIELADHSVLRRPEPHRVCDGLGERLLRIR